MAQDLQLFNQLIPQEFIKTQINSNDLYYKLIFNDYHTVYELLKKQKTQSQQTLKIYDYTKGLNSPGELFLVNDHINRIGHNPFIGKQNFFNIDFINVEQLYKQHKNGITANSCGQTLSTKLKYPTSYLANIAMMGLVLDYKIEGYLIHV